MPDWAGRSRQHADYRFLAVREPLGELALGDEALVLSAQRRIRALAQGPPG